MFVGLTPGVAELEGPGGNLDQSSRVSCVVNFYGATDFTKSYGKSVDAADVLPLFLGGDLEHARTPHLRASPLYWVSPNAAPVLSIHGTVDRYVAHERFEPHRLGRSWSMAAQLREIRRRGAVEASEP